MTTPVQQLERLLASLEARGYEVALRMEDGLFRVCLRTGAGNEQAGEGPIVVAGSSIAELVTLVERAIR